MFSYKIVAFLPNVCYNNKVNKNEKGVEAATPTPPIKTNTPFIYFPKHWGVDLKVETFCGVAKADTPLAPTSKTLIIRGDVAFGKLGVVYVK